MKIINLSYLDVEHTFTFLDGKHWTLAEPLVTFLGFGTNTSRALKRHCREHHYRAIRIDGVEGRSPLYVSLAGLVRLTIKSDHERAQDFQDWVTDDVVPNILTNRVYISPDATSADIISAAQERGILLALELNDQQALLTYNAQLQNRCVDFDGLEQDWLSVSQILEKRGYHLKSKAVDVSLSQIGKTVKKDYIEATGKEPKLTIKQVGQNHGTEIKSYPADWHDRIEQTAIAYWTKKGLIDVVK